MSEFKLNPTFISQEQLTKPGNPGSESILPNTNRGGFDKFTQIYQNISTSNATDQRKQFEQSKVAISEILRDTLTSETVIEVQNPFQNETDNDKTINVPLDQYIQYWQRDLETTFAAQDNFVAICEGKLSGKLLKHDKNNPSLFVKTADLLIGHLTNAGEPNDESKTKIAEFALKQLESTTTKKIDAPSAITAVNLVNAVFYCNGTTKEKSAEMLPHGLNVMQNIVRNQQFKDKKQYPTNIKSKSLDEQQAIRQKVNLDNLDIDFHNQQAESVLQAIAKTLSFPLDYSLDQAEPLFSRLQDVFTNDKAVLNDFRVKTINMYKDVLLDKFRDQAMNPLPETLLSMPNEQRASVVTTAIGLLKLIYDQGYDKTASQLQFKIPDIAIMYIMHKKDNSYRGPQTERFVRV
ncbi:hypothetical protein HYV64_00295 [Candidatus Shapirobacteria bacterium]|nr:hypothetical protein [Candidatus Shapirobacteria bacterium]